MDFSILDKPIVLVRVLIQTKDLDTPVFTGSCLEDGIAGALDGLVGVFFSWRLTRKSLSTRI